MPDSASHINQQGHIGFCRSHSKRPNAVIEWGNADVAVRLKCLFYLLPFSVYELDRQRMGEKGEHLAQVVQA